MIGFIVCHARKGARHATTAQAICALGTFALSAALALLGAGCAHAPVAASGAEARARLLADHAAARDPIRGVGTIDADVSGRKGSFEARWGSAGESLVVIGYAGPVRVLDASLLRDSLFVGIHREEFAVTGRLRRRESVGAEAIRFLLRPWDFGAPWVREGLEHAAVEPVAGGWRLRGTGTTPSGRVAFSLDVSERGEPRRLELAEEAGAKSVAVVRYGPSRAYAAGRYPRWVEWTRERARVRLDLRDVDRLPDGRLRLLPPAPGDWRVVGLDDPDGRSLLGRLLGGSKEGDPR